MGLMTLDLFKRIIDQAEGNCEAVTLASRGEPLLNPRISDMLGYAAGKFLALKVNSNASVLEEPVCSHDSRGPRQCPRLLSGRRFRAALPATEERWQFRAGGKEH